MLANITLRIRLPSFYAKVITMSTTVVQNPWAHLVSNAPVAAQRGFQNLWVQYGVEFAAYKENCRLYGKKVADEEAQGWHSWWQAKVKYATQGQWSVLASYA